MPLTSKIRRGIRKAARGSIAHDDTSRPALLDETHDRRQHLWTGANPAGADSTIADGVRLDEHRLTGLNFVQTTCKLDRASHRGIHTADFDDGNRGLPRGSDMSDEASDIPESLPLAPASLPAPPAVPTSGAAAPSGMAADWGLSSLPQPTPVTQSAAPSKNLRRLSALSSSVMAPRTLHTREKGQAASRHKRADVLDFLAWATASSL